MKTIMNITIIITGLFFTSALPLMNVEGAQDPITQVFAAQLVGVLMITLAALKGA